MIVELETQSVLKTKISKREHTKVQSSQRQLKRGKPSVSAKE
jgi:hypothetical protein